MLPFNTLQEYAWESQHGSYPTYSTDLAAPSKHFLDGMFTSVLS